MEVVVVSKDTELQKLCREVLGEILGTGWGFTVRDYTHPCSDADLHIWDFNPNTDLLKRLDSADWQKHLILLRREDLALMQESSFPVVNVILKPFAKATLRALLEQVCGRFIERPAEAGERINHLRADRDELLQCVIQANLKLQEYDQDRTNFLARAIHDFRAPLTALSGYCGLLLGSQLGELSEDQREVIQRMQHSAKRLSRMANAMFQLSIYQRIDQRPNLQEDDIREIVEQALHETLPLLEEKRINVSVDIVPPEEPLAFEKSQLEQVLINLLDNACKFTPRSGSAEIRGYPFFWDRRQSMSDDRLIDRRMRQERAANSYRIDIHDSGPGIPPSQLETIFEEYTSYSGGTDRSGGGLGLAICRMILNRHHGRVWAESSAGGATFSLVLPFHREKKASSAEANGLHKELQNTMFLAAK
jgi:signal transduction histidine kinase